MEAMIILSKEETSSKVKKLEKHLLNIFEEFGVRPQGGSATEISFMVDMEEDKLEEISEIIKERAEEKGFEFEVLKQ